MSPVISVIVPIYNSGPALRRSIDSLLNQTLTNIELIAVDDASTDGSAEMLNALAKQDSRIKVLQNQVNQGVQRTRARGVLAATAPWIGFLDADDIARPDMFKRMYTAGESAGADIVVCGAYRTNGDRKIIASKVRFRQNRTVTTDLLERFCALEFGTGMLWNKVFRRETILPHFATEFPWRQDINEDLIVNIGCFADAKKVQVLKDMLYEYVLRDDSASSSTSPASAFVLTYRAYAVAVSLFRDRGTEFLDNVTNLYRRQLSWPAYHVDESRALSAFRQDIIEANELVTATYPEGLAALAITRSTHRRRWKALIPKPALRLISRLRQA